jgi:hypothetical protein
MAAATASITMRSIAITTLLLVAPASLVSAAPGPEETTERISYSGKRPKAHAAAPEPGWIELASPTPASHGREFVVVGAGAGTFTQLRITAASGRPEIHSVRVDYQDGSHKVFQVGRVLDARRRPAYLDLRGAHELKQVVVVTEHRSSGSYVIEGNVSDTSVATR